MQLGLVGLPRVGKTTLFSALVGKVVDRTYGKRETHVAVAKVPDPRLPDFTAIFQPKREIPATVEYVDIAGLEAGAGKAGYDENFLKTLAQTNALVLVLRGFDAEDGAAPDPVKEFVTAEEEFLLNDLGLVERRLSRLEGQIKKQKSPALEAEFKLMQMCFAVLEQEKPLRTMNIDLENEKLLRGFQFLSYKPLMVVINYGEEYAEKVSGWEAAIRTKLTERSTILSLQAEIEAEIAQLEEADRTAFLADLGIAEPAAHRVIRECYSLLNLISFFTVGEDECRAWTLTKGTNAVGAAGVIHSDLARGFIRAEVTRGSDMLEHRSLHVLKEKGLSRLEGKEYVVQDGDILVIRFAV
ncbi:MAG: YchF family ATPase [bacterium]|nr:YchF family ATPase [bacterium]